MTKTISIYAAQILLGVVAIAAGYAKLTGTGVMVQQFQTIGLGHGFLMIAGTAEIAAGLCLLSPRGGIVGALLLASVMVGALGVTIGHVASATAPPAVSFTNTTYPAPSRADQIFRERTEWTSLNTSRSVSKPGSIPGVADQRLLLASDHDEDDAEDAAHRRCRLF